MATHRASGEGTIVKRADGRWCAAVQLNGRRTYVYGRTRADVVEKPRAVTDQARTTGRLPSAGKLTVGAYLDNWLEQARSRLRPGTTTSYRTLTRCHITPNVGALTLARLQPLHLARL